MCLNYGGNLGDVIKTLISESIKGFEQGKLQDFCLSFLPLYDEIFIKLERHGATAEGKTRKGTPDLIKTLDDGSHICVQCSVEKTYWNKTKDIDEWKPIKDIIKCKKNIDNIKSIVLCASQEIPTSLPTIKAEIKASGKKYTDAEIIIWSISNFEEELRKDICRYADILKNFFPDLYDYLTEKQKRATAEIQIDLYKRYPVPLNVIEQIVGKFCQESFGQLNITEIELKIAEASKSRYQRTELPNKLAIHRRSVEKFLEKYNGGGGGVYTVLGVPKIGKTSWVSQICDELKKCNYEIIWFDAPYQQNEHSEFVRDFVRILLSKIANQEIANQYVDKKIGIDEISSFFEKNENTKSYMFVLDNFEKISKKCIDILKEILKLVKNNLKGKLNAILISNKSLEIYWGSLSTEIYCPAWEVDEIKQLISEANISIKDNIENYCKVLTNFCGGHPLIALNLAKKASRIVDLLTIKPKTTPALQDEDLTIEIKNILFDDLLQDTDQRDLVLRLSILISRANLELINFLAQEIEVTLRTPVKLLIDKLRGTILEGNDNIGYSVEFVFSQIAKDILSDKEKDNIYNKVGNFLMNPKNNVVNANDAIDAIFYALLAKNLVKVFIWTNLLLRPWKKSFTKDQLKILLQRLVLIESLNSPQKGELKLFYWITILTFAFSYQKIDDLNKAIFLFKKLIAEPIDEKNMPKNFPIRSKALNSSVKIFCIFTLIRNKENIEALKFLNELDIESFLDIFRNRTLELSFLHLLVLESSLDTFPKDFFNRLINEVKVNEEEPLRELTYSYCNLGLVAYREKNLATLEKIVEPNNLGINLQSIFSKIAMAQYYLESGEVPKCLNLISEIFALDKKLKINSRKHSIRIFQMQGDAFFILKKYKKAFLSYKKCQGLINDEDDSFDFAWTNYRLGLSTENNKEAITFFEKASESFNKIGELDLKARSLGEKAISLYKNGNVSHAIDLLVSLVDDYFVNGILPYGPAVTVSLAMLPRIISNLKGIPFEDEKNSKLINPKLEKRVFAGILNEAKPMAGRPSAYCIISNVYNLLGNKKNQKKYLEIAFKGEELIDEDKSGKILAGVQLYGLVLEEKQFESAFYIIKTLMSLQYIYDLKDREKKAGLILGMLDYLLKEGKILYSNYLNAIEEVEKSINSYGAIQETRYWWLAAIYKRKAGIDGVTAENAYNYDFLQQAYEFARISKNYNVLLDTSHQLGFKFISKVASIQKLIEYQLGTVLAICNNPIDDLSRLERVGYNLKVWSKLTYKSVRASELKYWKNLRDRANRIDTEVPKELHPPLMILFLLLVTDAEKNKEYEKAVEWSVKQLKDKLDKISSDDYEYIEKLFI